MKIQIITQNLALSRKTARSSAFVILFWAIILAVFLNMSSSEKKPLKLDTRGQPKVKVWALKPEKEMAIK